MVARPTRAAAPTAVHSVGAMASRAMSEMQDEEYLGDGLNPGADQGQSLAGDVTAEVGDGEGGSELL
jgi:hypothetical protein